ncbi:MAG: DUF4331 domain-containing protein [Scytolyngbya sp. HA4215-MV1]|jgi:hypothetical protein|nr:DUF4331 domain-containing protein [Scytolyngbya sp. HA4215-MV1]
MSHHLDSPTAQEDGRVDITDIYIFAGEAANTTVLIMAVNPLAGEVSPTTFRAGALYDFKIDTNADVIEDLGYRVTFGEPDSSNVQRIELRRLEGSAAAEFDRNGKLIAEGNTGEVIAIAGSGRLWTGLVADPFFFNLGAFGQFAKLILEENRFDPSVFDTAENALAGHNVTAIVLELPNSALGAEAIQLWGTTTIQHDGNWKTINRAATPLVQQVFIQDEHLKDAYNKSLPKDDVAKYGEAIAAFTAKVTQLAGTTTNPQAYAQQVVQFLLPDVLTYNPKLPVGYGFAGRNGRALADDTPDLILSLLANTPFSDRVGKPDGLRAHFPYLAEANAK